MANVPIEVLIKLGLVGEENAKNAKQLISETAESGKDLAKELEKGGDTAKTFGSNLEEAGEKSEKANKKHLQFRQLLGEINQILPGLGHALHPVAEAYNEAGEAAKGAEGGALSFNTALGEAITTMGPLVIAMVGIEAAMKLWESYKEGVIKAAEAQEEATKRIVESTHEALKAVQELNEALNPKEKSLADHDEEKLKHQLDQQEKLFQREKEINKQREQNALAVANTPAQKKAVEEQFADLDKGLEIWNQKMRSSIASGMAEAIGGQINEFKNKLADLTAGLAEQFKILSQAPGEISDLQTKKSEATQTIIGPNGIAYQAPDVAKQDAIDKQIAAKQALLNSAQAEYDNLQREIEDIKKQAGPLGEKQESIQDQADTDAGNVSAGQRTNQAVRALRLSGQADVAINNEKHATTLEEARSALQESQAVGRQLVAAIQDAHATHNSNLGQLLAAYNKIRNENIAMTRQIEAMPGLMR